MKTPVILASTCSLCLILGTGPSSFAGTAPAAPPPVSVPEEVSGLLGGIGLEASVGWDSHYFFRGELLQENTIWAQLSYDLALTDSLSLNLTPWFLQDVDTDYNELNLTGALTYTVEPWAFSLGYAGYYYPRKSLGGNEGIDDEQEMNAAVSRTFGNLTATLLGVYNFTRDAFYFELAVDYGIEITDSLSLTPGVVLGWDTDYYAGGTDVNHVALRLAADYQLAPWCTLSPYLAGNLPMGHLDQDYGNDIYGGVSLTVAF